MNATLDQQLGAELDALREARTYKQFLTLESPQGPVVRMQGRGEVISEFPADMHFLAECEPVYETMPGWATSTAGVKDFKELPEKTRAYVDKLSELVGCEIGLVSTGPDRDETILRGGSAIASWFA